MSNPAFHPSTAVQGAKNGSGAPVEVEKVWPWSGRYRQVERAAWGHQTQEAARQENRHGKSRITVRPSSRFFGGEAEFPCGRPRSKSYK